MLLVGSSVLMDIYFSPPAAEAPHLSKLAKAPLSQAGTWRAFDHLSNGRNPQELVRSDKERIGMFICCIYIIDFMDDFLFIFIE